jgi:C2H2 type zinc-finger (2 copies)
MEEIDKIFSSRTQQEKTYVKIKVAEWKLLMGGEVPPEWLKTFKDFRSWHDFKLNCAHCDDQTFQGLYSLLSHIRDSRLTETKTRIPCFICNKSYLSTTAGLSAYVNHSVKQHYEFIRFCCIICSKVFQNMPLLSRHYQQEHSHENLAIFPCYDCGQYFQSLKKLDHHVQSAH